MALSRVVYGCQKELDASGRLSMDAVFEFEARRRKVGVALADTLYDPKDAVRREAAAVLSIVVVTGAPPDVQIIKALRSASQDSDPGVRASAQATLEKLASKPDNL